MSNSIRMKSFLWKISQALVFLLLMILPMPGTIALRYGLVALLLPVTVVLWKSTSCKGGGSGYKLDRAPLYLMGLLTGWIMLVIALWSVETDLNWQEFRGQWLSAVCIGGTGWLLASAAVADSGRRVREIGSTIFWSLLTLVLLHNIFDALYLVSSGTAPFRESPMMSLPVFLASWPLDFSNAFVVHSPDKMSYVTNLLAAVIVAEVAQRLTLRKPWLTCSNIVLIMAVMMVLLCAYWLRVRNGSTGMLMLLTVSVFMLSWRLKYRFGLLRVSTVAILLLAGLATLATLMVRSDPRWLKFEQTIPIAWDTETHRAWLELDKLPQSLPLMPNGEVVDGSAYLRLAWAKEGVKLIVDKPLGVGYSRTAFGDSIERKYHNGGSFRGGHAHSDLIEFTIANGVVGLLLWLIFLAGLFFVGWRAFGSGQIMVGLTIMFLVTGFAARSLVDANIKDDTLQQFFFLVFVFYGFATSNQKTERFD